MLGVEPAHDHNNSHAQATPMISSVAVVSSESSSALCDESEEEDDLLFFWKQYKRTLSICLGTLGCVFTLAMIGSSVMGMLSFGPTIVGAALVVSILLFLIISYFTVVNLSFVLVSRIVKTVMQYFGFEGSDQLVSVWKQYKRTVSIHLGNLGRVLTSVTFGSLVMGMHDFGRTIIFVTLKGMNLMLLAMALFPVVNVSFILLSRMVKWVFLYDGSDVIIFVRFLLFFFITFSCAVCVIVLALIM